MDNLNEVMDYIEANLTEEIDYAKLARMVGISSYTLQRVFSFLTGMTLTDYIRKRRLSKALEELQMTNQKVIDIAVKYKYDSPAAFSRAFFKMHGILPSDVRKKECVLKVFPKIVFEQKDKSTAELEYRVLKLDEQILYGKSTGIISGDDKKSIGKLWYKCNHDGTMNYIRNKAGNGIECYGAAECIVEEEDAKIKYHILGKEDAKMKYYVLGKKEKAGFEKLVIPEATWIAFKVPSKKQEDIISVVTAICTKWLPSSQYKIIMPFIDLEIYYDNYCEYCVAVE